MNTVIKNNLSNGIVSNRVKFILDIIDLDDSKIILDIGSWHLDQAIELSSIFPNSEIHAFEPVPLSYQDCLNKSFLHKNIKVHNIALSNFNGETSFFCVDSEKSSKPNIGASSLNKFIDGLNGSFFGESWIQKEIKVNASTLDAWCNKMQINTIDVVWIDVQGAELNVFKGAKEILKNTKIIFTEVGLKPYYENHSLKPEIDDFFNSIGFQEVKESFELNGFDYEANTIYINKKYLQNE